MRHSLLATAAAVLLAPTLALAQIPAPATAVKLAPVAQAQPVAKPPIPSNNTTAQNAARNSSKRLATSEAQHAMPQAHTASAELDYAMSDVRRNRNITAGVALGNAEVTLLNDREVSKARASDSARVEALSNVIDHVTAARAALARNNHTAAEQAIQAAQTGLHAIPAQTT
jgi:hypothetical protein